MQSPDNWQINLNKEYSLLLVLLLILLYITYGYFLWGSVLSNINSDLSWQSLERARKTGENILASKAIFYKDALRQLKEAIKFNRRDTQLYYRYAKIILEIADSHQISSAIDSEEIGAMSEGKEGLYSLAMTRGKRSVFKEPTNAAYHKELGSIYDKLSDPQQAEREFENALLLDPQNAELQVFLLEYFLSKGREEKFQRQLSGALQLYYSCRGKDGVLARTMEDFLQRINRQDLIEEGRAGVTPFLQRDSMIQEGSAE